MDLAGQAVQAVSGRPPAFGSSGSVRLPTDYGCRSGFAMQMLLSYVR